MTATLVFAALAGLLSTLSPCVLPLLPIVLATATSEHRLGPLALAIGLATSFTGVGLSVATVGFAIGIDGGFFRTLAAAVMILIGAVIVLPRLNARFAVAAGPIANWAESRLSNLGRRGLAGQFLVGMLLGAVWSPCVGPTLGAATVMAAQGEDLASVALTMLAFGLGAALPLLLVGVLSREAAGLLRERMVAGRRHLQLAIGGALVVAGALVISGLDKIVETELVARSPAWLTSLTVAF